MRSLLSRSTGSRLLMRKSLAHNTWFDAAEVDPELEMETLLEEDYGTLSATGKIRIIKRFLWVPQNI